MLPAWHFKSKPFPSSETGKPEAMRARSPDLGSCSRVASSRFPVDDGVRKPKSVSENPALQTRRKFKLIHYSGTITFAGHPGLC